MVYIGSVAVFDLSPGSDAGAYFEQVFVMWCTGYNLIDVKLPFGAWANQGHFPPQDVPELGQFVQAVFAHGAPPGGNPVVAILRQLWALVFCIGIHGAELNDKKRFAIDANPLLPVKNRALRRHFYPQSNVGIQWSKNQQKQRRSRQINHPFDDDLPVGQKVLANLNQYCSINVVHFYGPQHDIVHVGDDVDLNGWAEFKQGIEDLANTAVFAAFHGNDHFFYVAITYHSWNGIGISEFGQMFAQRGSVLHIGINKAQQFVAKTLFARS